MHFLNETGLSGTACRGPSLTLTGTLSAQGLGAVQLFEGTLNYERFALYVSRFLAPRLRSDNVLVLDNLTVHKLGGLREWLAECGIQVLFLPPYSPGFSPIEQAWSELKTAVRPAQAQRRQALKEFMQDAQHGLNHCGYHVQPA